jgi:hypothetical protein
MRTRDGLLGRIADGAETGCTQSLRELAVSCREFRKRGERRILLLSASLADQAQVSLGDAITGIDDRNAGLLVKAVLHASGRRQFPR